MVWKNFEHEAMKNIEKREETKIATLRKVLNIMCIHVKIQGYNIAVPVVNQLQALFNLAREASQRLQDSGIDIDIQSDQCYFKKFYRDEFYIIKPSDIIKDVLSDGDLVEIMIKKEPKKRKETVRRRSERELSPLPVDPENNVTTVELDGDSLDLDTLMQLSNGDVTISINDTTMLKLVEVRQVVTDIIKQGLVRYGINTGYGILSKVVIEDSDLEQLSYNIIRSHCAGVGEALSPETVRRMFALRINVLAKGASGCSTELVQQMVSMLNKNCLPYIPAQGTVGASGDLCPLAHLAVGIIGEGRMWSPSTGWGDATDVLTANGLKPFKLKVKDGICLINGTQFICAIGAEVLHRAKNCIRTAVVTNALVLDVLEGHIEAFDERVNAVRPHPGQGRVAAAMRAICHSKKYPSEMYDKIEKHDVQDPYTLRCVPQVLGVTLDTVSFAENILTTEFNSATDNPLVFLQKDGQPGDHDIISAGNFHGEYPAKALDFLAIAVHEIGNMAERRIERLVNPTMSKLPAFLVENPGLNSGFMIAHVTSAALVSENKTLCFPSSADTQTTSAGKEDHVSMGGWSARKALRVIKNLENVLAIELTCACQALEFRRPHTTTEPLEAVYRLVRTKVEPLVKDRYLADDFKAVQEMIQRNEIWKTVMEYLDTDPLFD